MNRGSGRISQQCGVRCVSQLTRQGTDFSCHGFLQTGVGTLCEVSADHFWPRSASLVSVWVTYYWASPSSRILHLWGQVHGSFSEERLLAQTHKKPGLLGADTAPAATELSGPGLGSSALQSKHCIWVYKDDTDELTGTKYQSPNPHWFGGELGETWLTWWLPSSKPGSPGHWELMVRVRVRGDMARMVAGSSREWELFSVLHL